MTNASNLTNQIDSPHLRPHTADLNRLLAGEHHDPHSVLGAHEYDDHTVIRVYRPHAVKMNAVIGGRTARRTGGSRGRNHGGGNIGKEA